MSNPPVERLAECLGIEPFFHDIWGHRYDVSTATRRALIGAMGIAAETDQEASDSLQELQAADLRSLVPPVRVFLDAEPLTIAITISEPAGAPIRWCLTEESGAVHRGRIARDGQRMVDEQWRDGQRFSRVEVVLPLRLPLGYHALDIETESGATLRSGRMLVAIAPERCLGLEEVVPRGRVWGIGVQLYGVRSAANWGIGDFSDLGRLSEIAAGLGAATLGINPLHALFPGDPAHISPYSPSSRRFLNFLYLDVVAVPDLAESEPAQRAIGTPEFQRELSRLRETQAVDYVAVAALKRPILELLFESFENCHLANPSASPRAQAFRQFCRDGGSELLWMACFDALHQHFYQSDAQLWDWQAWPEPFRQADSAEVADFIARNHDRIEFYQYLQWLADDQLKAAAVCGRTAGLSLGLYRDLAVASHPGGADAWMEPALVRPGARVGCPPDPFNLMGQNWGLAPLSPTALRAAAYAPFIQLLRANMRNAGLLRIDHVMALRHLFWFPAGASEGAYVSYPFRDLTRLLALESRRNHCVVIGEDLGTVPEGFRPAMQHAGVLSYRVLYFERKHDRGFLPPSAYPEQSLVTVTTHDLATLRGFWSGLDLDWRDRLGLYPDQARSDSERAERHHDRIRLLEALASVGLLPFFWRAGDPLPPMTAQLVTAIHRFLATAPGRVLMVQLEDATGESEQPNLPGTVDEHPNWRRRLDASLDQISRLPALQDLAQTLVACGR